MLAGGMTIAAPSMMVPEAQAAGALFVSAENAMFGNTFGGAQIVEVVVIDPARQNTGEQQGEPQVKVYEKQLRMAQASDGNWYGYFGSAVEVLAADTAGNNLDFGADDNPDLYIGNFAAATNVFQAAVAGTVGNAPSLSNWNSSAHHLGVAEFADRGQIGVKTAADWPFIQLYDFTIGTFDVVYEQAGADEVVSLDYNSGDLDDFASLELDRNAAPQGAQVHLTITDNQLNIDPTAKDVVIFYVGDTAAPSVSFTTGAAYGSTDWLEYDNYFGDNGKLIINNNTLSADAVVLTNDATLDDVTADNYMVFFEGAENSGVFFNTDDDSDSSLEISVSAKRGTTATFDYNDSSQSLLVSNSFGTIDMDESSVGDAWNSGEALTVTLIDEDMNLNTASNEDLLVNNATLQTLVPSLQIGSPLTTLASVNATSATSGGVNVTSYSKIAYYWNDSSDITTGQCIEGGKKDCGYGDNGFNFTISNGYTGEQLKAISQNADGTELSTVYFNYDFTSFTNATNVV